MATTKGQFCRPGYDLPDGCFMRSPKGTFPEYLIKTIDVLERNETYSRVDGRGEPQLGRRGLYRVISGQKDQAAAQLALLWVLNLADGRHSLLDMAERSRLAFDQVAAAAEVAVGTDLIRRTLPSGAEKRTSTVPEKS